MKGCGQELGPRSPSDGTLRFLALVTMQLDPSYRSVLCLEEPENGMHPGRVPAMVGLLRDFAVDPTFARDDDNPLRQVILNTHSPDVARQLDMDQVLFVDSVDMTDGRAARVRPVVGTWRGDEHAVTPQRLADEAGLIHRVAEGIVDFAALLQLEAFAQFAKDLKLALGRLAPME